MKLNGLYILVENTIILFAILYLSSYTLKYDYDFFVITQRAFRSYIFIRFSVY